MMKSRPCNSNAAGFVDSWGMYDPAFERDACGIGFIARIDGDPRHSVVEDACKILINLEHRGAIGGDKSTGDGAGLLLQIPDKFFREEFAANGKELPSQGDYAVGSVFLPADDALRERCKKAFESIAVEEECEVLGWRDVQVDPEGLGEMCVSAMPTIRQIFLGRGSIEADRFELKLYVIRRLVEKEVESWDDVDASLFYVPSLSCRTVNYKGMLTGTQLASYYLDLKVKSFASAFSLVHQRYSTNTLPTWKLAQPFRFLAHNGEINTLRGNINQMRACEAILESPLFGDDIEKIKPIIQEGGSDSAIFDSVLELLVAAGRSVPHAMMMMIPEAWGQKYLMGDDKRDFYEYHGDHGAVGWTGFDLFYRWRALHRRGAGPQRASSFAFYYLARRLGGDGFGDGGS